LPDDNNIDQMTRDRTSGVSTGMGVCCPEFELAPAFPTFSYTYYDYGKSLNLSN